MFCVLFVCTGNICRSPTAEGVLRKLANERGLTEHIKIDSAGIGTWHVGDPPDLRSTETAKQHGVDISGQRARAIELIDFEAFDLILAMDNSHFQHLKQRCPKPLLERLGMFMSYATGTKITEVPDPYYGQQDGFERVFNMIEDAGKGLLTKLQDKLAQ
tara:strand:- start:327 stop:803 length:477 start_codon:yes stop_codon:yes gene_type:complete